MDARQPDRREASPYDRVAQVTGRPGALSDIVHGRLLLDLPMQFHAAMLAVLAAVREVVSRAEVAVPPVVSYCRMQ